MMTCLHQIKKALLDLLFPPHCVSCHSEGAYLCPACWSEIPRVHPPVCDRCGRPVYAPGSCPSCVSTPPAIDGIRSAAFFEGAIREAIHYFKYEGLTVLSEPLGELLAEGWRAARPPGDIILPVPLHPRRVRQRGYNQAMLLAQELSRRVGLPVVERAVVRVRETAP